MFTVRVFASGRVEYEGERYVMQTRLQTTTLTIDDGTGATSIRQDHGCDMAPQSVTDLEDSIISAAGVARWVGRQP